MKKIIMLISIVFISILFMTCGKSVKKISSDKETVKEVMNTSPETIESENVIQKNIPEDISLHSGEFTVTMSGFKGELVLSNMDGVYSGTIKFFSWGNGIPQPLTDLKITDDKIFFKRVIKTREDLTKYGGTAFFEQDFYGIFTADKKTIKGYYRYTGTQDNWEAKRK